MLKRFRSKFELNDLNIDSPEAARIASEIIASKPFLKQLYQSWYVSIVKALRSTSAEGRILELGSGAGFLKEYVPGLITSELLQVSNVDLLLDAQHLPFGSASLRAILMIDVLHHIPEVRQFLEESARCVKPGGALILIEPWITAWSGWVYRNLHHEPFDPDTSDWHFPRKGPLSGANSALPWIMFERDRDRFDREISCWKIHSLHLHTPFAYLLSGGLSTKGTMPGIAFNFCRHLEKILAPWTHRFAMFATIILVRRNRNSAC